MNMYWFYWRGGLSLADELRCLSHTNWRTYLFSHTFTYSSDWLTKFGQRWHKTTQFPFPSHTDTHSCVPGIILNFGTTFKNKTSQIPHMSLRCLADTRGWHLPRPTTANKLHRHSLERLHKHTSTTYISISRGVKWHKYLAWMDSNLFTA